MSDIYFVYRRITFEDGNSCQEGKHFMGCFKKYESAKEVVKKFIADRDEWPEVLWKPEHFEPKLCDCCGEIEAWNYDGLYSGDQISIYKCSPH